MKKQVDKLHYEFGSYMKFSRWASLWHQINIIIGLEPKRVLEIGPGPGVFKATASAFGLNIETLDLDPELEPDYVASVFDMPFGDGDFDVVCAFQMLEHLPYEQSLLAFNEIARVSGKNIVISLPDAKTAWPVSLYLPSIGMKKFLVPRPRLKAQEHVFDGEHYWEVNKKGYSLTKVIRDFSIEGWSLMDTYRIHENPYHRFFIYKNSSGL